MKCHLIWTKVPRLTGLMTVPVKLSLWRCCVCNGVEFCRLQFSFALSGVSVICNDAPDLIFSCRPLMEIFAIHSFPFEVLITPLNQSVLIYSRISHTTRLVLSIYSYRLAQSHTVMTHLVRHGELSESGSKSPKLAS